MNHPRRSATTVPTANTVPFGVVTASRSRPPKGASFVHDTVDAAEGARGAHTFDTGAVINGRYTVLGALGEGGMGVVYSASDARHPERRVALKTVVAGPAQRHRIAMFKSEFLTMARLHHPNLAEVYDFEPIVGSDELYLFSMERIEGRDAFAATADASLEAIVDLLVQCCRALSYVHSRQVIHFDLKPSNILVEPDGRVRIVDFGVAGAARQARGGVAGTPHYMAPELTGDATHVDQRVDLYALGITLFELLFRRLPFDGDSLFELGQAHHYRALPLDGSPWPRWVHSLLERLCAKQPDHRFRSANDVIQAINETSDRTFELETQETRQSYVFSSRFVGRDWEHDRLWTFIRHRTQTSPGSVPAIFVGGQSGVGKSRLLRELRRTCQLHRVPFFEADCYERARSELQPIVRALSFLVPFAESSGHHELVRRHAPQLVKLDAALAPGTTPAAPHGDPAREREHVLGAAVDLIVGLSERTAFVLYLNDLHWADSGTADVLRRVLKHLHDGDEKTRRLALLGTYRDDELEGRPLESVLESLPDHGARSIVQLEPLAKDHVATVVRSMIGDDALPEGFLRTVADATLGNPFFVEELMRAFIENEQVCLRDGRWTVASAIDALPIPTSMDDAFRRRLAMLAPAPTKLLEVCAVHGKSLDADVLQRAAGVAAEDLFVGIAVLRERFMLRATPDGPTAFVVAHDRMREVVLETVGARKPGLHRRLALALERTNPELEGTLLVDVANHWLDAGTTELGDAPASHVAELLYRAAKQAKSAAQYETAATYLEHALACVEHHASGDLTPPLESRIRAELLAVLYLVDHDVAEGRFSGLCEADRTPLALSALHQVRGMALIARGRYVDAYRGTLLALRDLGIYFPVFPSLLRALLALMLVRFLLRKLPAEAIAALPETPDDRFRAALKALEAGGMASSFAGAAPFVHFTAKAMRLMLRHGVSASAGVIVFSYGATLQSGLRRYQRGYAYCRAGMALADRFGNEGFVATTHGWVGAFSAVWCVPLAEAQELVRRSQRIFIERGEGPLAEMMVDVYLTIDVWISKTAEAWLGVVREHEALLASAGSAHTLVEVEVIARLIATLGGPTPRFRFSSNATDDDLRASLAEDHFALCLVWCLKALEHALYGRWVEAADAAALSFRHSERCSNRQFFNAVSELLYVVCTTRAGRARWPYPKLRRVERHLALLAKSCAVTFAPMHALTRAELARAAGRPGRAAPAYLAAAEGAEAAGHRLLAALAWQLAAHFFADEGDTEKCADALERARTIHREWGAHRVADALDRPR